MVFKPWYAQDTTSRSEGRDRDDTDRYRLDSFVSSQETEMWCALSCRRTTIQVSGAKTVEAVGYGDG